jgi:hypothetical protein
MDVKKAMPMRRRDSLFVDPKTTTAINSISSSNRRGSVAVVDYKCPPLPAGYVQWRTAEQSMRTLLGQLATCYNDRKKYFGNYSAYIKRCMDRDLTADEVQTVYQQRSFWLEQKSKIAQEESKLNESVMSMEKTERAAMAEAESCLAEAERCRRLLPSLTSDDERQRCNQLLTTDGQAACSAALKYALTRLSRCDARFREQETATVARWSKLKAAIVRLCHSNAKRWIEWLLRSAGDTNIDVDVWRSLGRGLSDYDPSKPIDLPVPNLTADSACPEPFKPMDAARRKSMAIRNVGAEIGLLRFVEAAD